MKDKVTNPMNSAEEKLAQRIKQVREQTNVHSQFAVELEEKLRGLHGEQTTSWFGSSLRQISPVVRWVALMILLALALSLSITTLIPARQPAINGTPTLVEIATPTIKAPASQTGTPTTPDGGYDWRGTKLFLGVPLPEVPAEANVYSPKPDQPATAEEAQALAQQFGITGELYEAPGELPDTTEYMISDGKQRLYVRSSIYFTYYADYSANTILLGIKDITDEEVHSVIDGFLKSHGFEFEYQIDKEYRSAGVYYVIPLTDDGHAIRFDYDIPSRLQITIGRDKQVLSVDSDRIGYEKVGSYGIRSAEEAFQQILDSSNSVQNGVIETSHSGGVLNESYWERSYPDNEKTTIYGMVATFHAIDPDKPAFTSINGYTLTGNIPSVAPDQMIAATGEFQTENGIRRFNVEAWEPSKVTETSVSGTLQQEGDQTVLLSDDGTNKYVLADIPADVPRNTVIPDEQLMVNGILINENLIWTSIQYFPPGSNYGGGGGGGTGFYQLNLSGTPVPFSSPTALPEITIGQGEYTVRDGDTLASIAMNFGVSVERLKQANRLSEDGIIFVGQKLIIPDQASQHPLMGKRFENQRGILVVTIYRQADGSERTEYSFITSVGNEYYHFVLVGDGLEELKKYHNRPVNIWGVVEDVDQYNKVTMRVEKYEVPFPDLQFQLFKGKYENATVEGRKVTLFTATDGKKYVIRFPIGDIGVAVDNPDDTPQILEGLSIPDESFGGYPTLIPFGGGMAIDPTTGNPIDYSITADQPYVIDEAQTLENTAPPEATIEKVELVYYVSDPRYQPPADGQAPQYIQPAWRFYGHYSSGDEFEILVQALKQEYLNPELAPYTPPG